MYESYAYWKRDVRKLCLLEAIERLTLDVIVVIVYFVLSSWRRLKQRRKRDVLLSNK